MIYSSSHRFKSCLSDYNKLGDADRKAQALVPVCCFVNKAVIRKAGNNIMNFAENENSRILPNVQSPIIYFLMDGDEVVYVGQSKIGLARPYSHKDKKFTKIAIINCKESELDDKETEFIKNISRNITRKQEIVIIHTLE